MRLLFFLINFSTAVLCAVSGVVALVTPFFGGGTPGAFCGAILLLGPTVAFALLEWRVYYRNEQRFARPLGALCLGLAGLTLLSVATTAGEAVVEGDASPSFFIGFTFVGLAITAYLTFCGWRRLRKTEQPRMGDSPNGSDNHVGQSPE